MNFFRIALITSVLTIIGCNILQRQSEYGNATRLGSEKRYDEAIEAYHRHIARRLAVKERPEWENPYIYLLDIGDLYLEQELVEEALKQYELAEAHGVKEGFVNDRYRNVANWYEERGKLEEAIEHLKKYEHKDPLLFGMMLDRIAKEIILSEQVRSATEEGASEDTDNDTVDLAIPNNCSLPCSTSSYREE